MQDSYIEHDRNAAACSGEHDVWRVRGDIKVVLEICVLGEGWACGGGQAGVDVVDAESGVGEDTWGWVWGVVEARCAVWVGSGNIVENCGERGCHLLRGVDSSCF